MDLLDSIADLKSTEKKSKRVRSWYLYEQFKSLERNQLDAAQRLKDRSYQDRILQQELTERRARRKLYDQYGLCHSESHIISKSTCEDNKTSLSASTDDFFESFCELQEDERSSDAARDTDTDDAYSQDDSQPGKRYLDKFKSLENLKDDQSFADSVNSVIRNCKHSDPFADDLKEELEFVKKSIAEEITQQFETVKENIQNLEKYSKFCSEDKISEAESSETLEERDEKMSLHKQESDINLCNIWSKLVSFAYQVVQLNHGNCYYDYSSQFLTAVLAFDVLRRGVSRMCDILQPYVSPIKFATDESDASTASYKKIRKKRSNSKKSRKPVKKQKHVQCECLSHFKTGPRNTKYFSDDYWRNLSRHSFGFRKRVEHRASEPWRSVAKFSTCKSEVSDKSSQSFWPSFSRSNLSNECPCHVKVANPMLKIGQYIDRLLDEIDDCKRIL